MLRYLRSTVLAAVVMVAAALFITTNVTQAAEQPGSMTCPPGGPVAFNRAICDGYFTGQDQYNNGIDVEDVIVNGAGSPSMLGVGSADEFIDIVETALNGADANDQKGAAFLIETMLGKDGTEFGTIAGGIAQAQADFDFWVALIRHYDTIGMVDWNPTDVNTTLPANFLNSGVSTRENEDAMFYVDPDEKDRPLIMFTNPDGSEYWINKNCANPTGEMTINPLFAEVSIGNFVWLDANNDGLVNGDDASMGVNGVQMELYGAAADTDGDGMLSAAELAAATALATQATADDDRVNSPTNGNPGFYHFTGLDEGSYFVCVAASNFAAGGVLEGFSNSPTPAGVADTQQDLNDHGDVPMGGTMEANGVCSKSIALSLFDEPTDGSANPDDDGSGASDYTIDFGFWHPYSLGNKVWCDTDNSATINAGDGGGTCPSLGFASVTMLLYDCDGNELASTTTDGDGYYRFDNLNAGCYYVKVAPGNFEAGGPLVACKTSSTGAGEEADPDQDVDNNDNGLVMDAMIMSGEVNLGPMASEPEAEADLASSGQGTTDGYANMTVDFGFVCELAPTGQPFAPLITTAAAIVAGGGALLGVRKFTSLGRN